MKPVQLVASSVAVCSLVLAGTAWGQPATPDAPADAAAPLAPPPPASPLPPVDPAPPPPPRGVPPAPLGKLVISAPPVPPPMQRAGYHVHDGFYLRLGAGVGGSHMNVTARGGGASDFKFGGPGLALNLWLGGTPSPGIVLGGMASLQGIGDSNVVVNGTETHADMSGGYLFVGPFVDAFPDPLRGLHLGGSLGLAALEARGSGSALEVVHQVKDYSAGGLGASAWIGYMGFVGPEFSLGGLLQLTVLGAGKTEDSVERKASGYGLSASFTALYH